MFVIASTAMHYQCMMKVAATSAAHFDCLFAAGSAAVPPCARCSVAQKSQAIPRPTLAVSKTTDFAAFSIYKRDLPTEDVFRVMCDLHSMRGAVLVLPSFYAGKMATIVRPCIVAGVTEGELWGKIRHASHAHKPLPPPQSNADKNVPIILSAITGSALNVSIFVEHLISPALFIGINDKITF